MLLRVRLVFYAVTLFVVKNTQKVPFFLIWFFRRVKN